MTDADSQLRETELACDGVRLHSRSIQPAGQVVARMAIIHGYGEHSGRYVDFMRWLAGHGIASNTFDFRGHGLSSGRRGHVQKWEDYLDDVQAFLKSIGNDSALPLFVLGHSHGGLVTIAAAQRGMLEPTKVRGCILSSPYLAMGTPPPLVKRAVARAANHLIPWLRVSSGLKSHWLSSDAEMVAQDRADGLILRTATPRWFLTMRQAQARARSEAAVFRLPFLCLVGGEDVIPDPQATAKFFEESRSADKSFYFYPGLVHELIRETERQRVFRDIMGWIKARM